MKLFILLVLAITDQNGINSDVTGLDGTDVQLAQIEIEGRSGRWGYDSAANSNSQTTPFGVYIGTGGSSPNNNVSDHATWVAGLMIGTDVGVAPGAQLHSAMPGFGGDLWADRATVMNRFAEQSQIPAINLSWGFDLGGGETVMATAYLTEFVDWSAKEHNTLYVAAHPYNEKPYPTPADNYNGLTVAGAQKTGDVYDKVWGDNYYDDIMAPVYQRHWQPPPWR